MADIQKLKALAEAANAVIGDVAIHADMESQMGSKEEAEAVMGFMVAANPAAVLELIAEVEALREKAGELRSDVLEGCEEVYGLSCQLAQRTGEVRELIAEVERLKQFEDAYAVWSEKTEWVQATGRPLELGLHRADVLRLRIEQLCAEVEALRKVKTAHALHAAVSAIYFDDGSDFGSALREVVSHLAPDLIDELDSDPSAARHKTEAMVAKESAHD